MNDPGERELQALVERVRADEGLVGVVLFGSRAWGHALDEHSDYDLVVIAADDDARVRFEQEVPFRRGDRLEVVTDTLAGLRAHAALGSESEWSRPSYLHARVLLDKTRGELDAIVAEKLRVQADVRIDRARSALDAYVNAYHRSARNRMVGLETAARLDAVESISAFFTAIFELEGRLRPFNKHLQDELGRRPLRDAAWAGEALLPRVERILDGDLSEQQALFRDLERVARAEGLGDVIDAWEPDVGWLRGEASYHAR